MGSTTNFLTRTLACLSVALAPLASQADVVYDSLTGAKAWEYYTLDPTTGQPVFQFYRYQYQSFASSVDPTDPSFISDPIASLGDLITLTPNTGRALTGVDVGVIHAQGAGPVDFKLRLTIYDVNKSVLATQLSGNIHLDLAPTSTSVNGTAAIIPLAFGPFNLPDTFYYTLGPEDENAPPPGVGIWLWDFYQDGSTPGAIPLGTDVGNTGDVSADTFTTIVYGTNIGSSVLTSALGNNQSGLSNGYTPAVRFNVATPLPPAAAIPEPATYATLALGMLGLAAWRARRPRRA